MGKLYFISNPASEGKANAIQNDEQALLSGDQPKNAGTSNRSLLYAFGKDGVRVTATLSQGANTVSEVRISALLPKAESLLGTQRAAADSDGIVHLDINSNSIPSGSTAIKISVSCDTRNSSKKQDFVIPIDQTPDKMIAPGTSNPCFE